MFSSMSSIATALHIKTLLCAISVAMVIKLAARYRKRQMMLPPGPYALPWLGYLKVLGPDIWTKFVALGNSYGPIFSFYLGSRLTVVLNNHQLIHEAFKNQALTFAGRPFPWTMTLAGVKEELNNGDYSAEWLKKKQFALQALKQFGYSTDALEEKVKQEINTLIGVYETLEGPIDPRQHMSKTMANLILSIMVNKRYTYDDPEFLRILSLIHEWQKKVGAANLLDMFPMLRFVPFWKPMVELRTVKQDICQVYSEFVEEHKRTYKAGVMRDVIDVYIQEYGVHYDSDKLIGLFFSFVGDAVDSLPETMVWTLLFLAYFPEYQQRLYDEILQIVGDAEVTLSRREELPYCEAFLREALRMSSFVPVTEPHKTLKDCEVAGYHIPKGSLVLGNLYAAHHDPLEWGDPQNFRPERFLNETEGKEQEHRRSARVFKQYSPYMPFSIGRRMCVADQLSMKVLFLFVTSLVKRFVIGLDNTGGEHVTIQAPSGYVRKAQDFKVTLHPR